MERYKEGVDVGSQCCFCNLLVAKGRTYKKEQPETSHPAWNRSLHLCVLFVLLKICPLSAQQTSLSLDHLYIRKKNLHNLHSLLGTLFLFPLLQLGHLLPSLCPGKSKDPQEEQSGMHGGRQEPSHMACIHSPTLPASLILTFMDTLGLGH